ncbi:IS1182 family transposase [Novosphingobium sp. SL115]|uniref:IS1182 family transposase n=1 Tax=Novosphingobium sp. SL115 TaxID=2995150 RepID=UPI0022734D14|nr:IS1182 family transposase [Novosphingobium sp. SL115]MCY1669479.1 IS1182 family transposase [Novosphingobium sp. SL115]
MMGARTVVQEALFYSFSLEDHVPQSHLLRAVDHFVDLSGIREKLRPFYSETGRPSIDPELMIRMLLIGYCLGIRSERRLCEEVHLNLAYRWFCRLGLDGAVPDHSTFSKNRHGRFRDSELLRDVFEMTVTRCIEEGLVGGEGFAVDASLIKADANRQRGVPGEDGLPPAIANHAAREYLEVLDEAAFGAASPATPKYLSPADPAARLTSAHGGQAFFAYSTNYLIDLAKAVIVDVEATTAIRPAEVTAQRTMIDRTQERFGIWPQRLAADTGYGDAANIAWLVHERGIEPHIPIFDHARRRTGSFQRDEFRYDHQHDLYVCPGSKELLPRCRNFAALRGDVDQDGLIRYRASKHDCGACALKPQCCPGQPNRIVPRSIHEGARDLARDLAKTDAYVTSRRERKKVEMLFAHLKRILKLDRLRLRGPNGAKDEFLLAATAQNLRKLAKLIPMPATPALA